MPLYNPSGNVVSASGNTTGTLATYAAGSVVLAGGNNVTLSQSSNSISIIGAAGGTGGAAITLGNSNLGNTSGTTGVISGSALQFLLAGGNNVTLSQSLNGSSVTITVSAANQTNQSVGLYAVSNTTLSTSHSADARSISFEGAGGVSVGVSNGSVVISGGAGGGGGNNTLGMSNLGNTAGTTGVISGSAVALYLAGGNNVTLSQSINGSTATITVSVANAAGQTNQTGNLYASSNTFGTSSGTFDARTLSFVGSGAVNVAASNSGIVISAAPYTTITQGNMVTISTAGSSMTIDAFANILSASGNTSGTLTTFSSGTMVLAGGNNITLSQSSNTITISAGAGGGGTNVSAFAVGNTTQSSSGTVAASAFSFRGDGAASVGVTGASVAISVPVQTNQTGNIYASSNTTGGTSGTYDARTLSIAGAGAVSIEASNSGFIVSAPVQSFLIAGNNISLSSNSNSITIADLLSSGPVSQFEPWEFGPNTSASSLGQSSLYFQHMVLPEMQACRMDRLISLSINAAVSGSSNATGTRSNVWTYNETLGLYTRGTGTNSTNLYSYMSNNWSFGITESVSIVTVGGTDAEVNQSYTLGFIGNIDTNGGTTSSTFSSASSSSSLGTSVSQANVISNVSGVLVLNVPFGSSALSAGDYWLAVVGRSAVSSGGTATTLASVSNIVLTAFNNNLQQLGKTVTGTSNTLVPGNGVFTAQTSAFPSSVAINAIGNNSNASLYGNIMNLSM